MNLQQEIDFIKHELDALAAAYGSDPKEILAPIFRIHQRLAILAWLMLDLPPR